MTTVTETLRDAWMAFGAFLRGFIGVSVDGDATPTCNHPDDNHLHRDSLTGSPTPASARAALIARAARRPNCC